MSETSDLKYRVLPEYRERVKNRVKERHRTNSDDPIYCEIVACRKRIYSIKEIIEYHQKKVKNAKRRLEYQLELKEALYAQRRERGILVRAYTSKKTEGNAGIFTEASKSITGRSSEIRRARQKEEIPDTTVNRTKSVQENRQYGTPN